jgi:hypothetical protein
LLPALVAAMSDVCECIAAAAASTAAAKIRSCTHELLVRQQFAANSSSRFITIACLGSASLSILLFVCFT